MKRKRGEWGNNVPFYSLFTKKKLNSRTKNSQISNTQSSTNQPNEIEPVQSDPILNGKKTPPLARFLPEIGLPVPLWTFDEFDTHGRVERRGPSFTTDLRQPRRKESGHRNPPRIPRGWSRSRARKHLPPFLTWTWFVDKRSPNTEGQGRPTPRGWKATSDHRQDTHSPSSLFNGAALVSGRSVRRQSIYRPCVRRRCNVIVHVNSCPPPPNVR